jgi:isochorismate hydrolase
MAFREHGMNEKDANVSDAVYLTDSIDEPIGEHHTEAPDAKSRTPLELDWESLAVAFENQLPNTCSFLNLKTGRVVTMQGACDSTPTPPDDTGDWMRITPRSSRDGYRTMQRFLTNVEDPVLRERLASVLVGRGAFRRFKDLLLDFPDVRQQWFSFKDSEVYAYIADWLERAGIQACNEPPAATESGHLQDVVRRSFVSVDEPLNPAPEGEEDLAWKQAIATYDRPAVAFRPHKSALLVVDMQRIFANPNGSSYLPMSLGAEQNLIRLVEKCRLAGLPVMYTRHVHRHPRQDGGAMARWWRSLIVEGSWESELIDDLRPASDERVFTKCRYSAFSGTELEMVLRSMGVEDLIIGGVMTNLCCETTARDAFVKDFNVFFLGDGTAAANMELHLASLRNIAYGFGRVMSTDEAIGTLSAFAG